jgi:uncharacterized protein (DUF58 family)
MTPLQRHHHEARRAAGILHLPLRRATWRGASGSILGHGSGSSIDFQDHRPYLPGDDPRHINWQAYARSGAYTMKLYRQEVSPRVDLILDTSASMRWDAPRDARFWELAYFCIESALQLGASLRVYAGTGDALDPVPIESLLAHRWEPAPPSQPGLVLDRLPLRHGSLRVVVSDLLFPCQTATLLRPLAAGQGRPMILIPHSDAEANPDWDGNIEFEDCETGTRELRRVDPALLARYHDAYRRHFELWRDEGRRLSVLQARVPAAPPLAEALRGDALAVGAVEL